MNELYYWPQNAYSQVGEKDKEKIFTIQHPKCSNKDMTGDNGNLSSNANLGITEDSLKKVMNKSWKLKSLGKSGDFQGVGLVKAKVSICLCKESSIRRLAIGV